MLALVALLLASHGEQWLWGGSGASTVREGAGGCACQFSMAHERREQVSTCCCWPHRLLTAPCPQLGLQAPGMPQPTRKQTARHWPSWLGTMGRLSSTVTCASEPMYWVLHAHMRLLAAWSDSDILLQQTSLPPVTLRAGQCRPMAPRQLMLCPVPVRTPSRATPAP